MTLFKLFTLGGLLLLAGCTDPTLSAGMVIGPDGLEVQPVLSGTVGGTGISVQPL